ncbi:Enhancer of polycomb-like transcription factor protein putative isoform 1 [Tripterygium wilfordii]|uniref:Enhancer of polycomb-like protein n=1 Tax=Tripterygium wilfordii TaxID=458696 RepID=A0A7J7C5K5_TRIWF|nr:uncharacterized protein LOC119988854 [Tripterygium wilfordii]KAF5729424.1 Enhancer of polycomb-like transcription factor protein putative isoform 1 [Tripterygium wilfordii]
MRPRGSVNESRRELSELVSGSREVSGSSGTFDKRFRSTKSSTPMLSVGMRRSTRVFGMAKGGDSALVLRSGRRLFPESGENRGRRVNDGDDWCHPMKNKNNSIRNSNDGKSSTTINDKRGQNGWARDVEVNPGVINVDGAEIEVSTDVKIEHSKDRKMFGLVYSRKRKERDVQCHESSGGSENRKQRMRLYHRRQWKKNDRSVLGMEREGMDGIPCMLAVVVEGTCGGSSLWFSCFLRVVLSYMKRAIVRLSQLTAFLSTEPVYNAYASQGIRFLQGPPLPGKGVCKFFAARQFVPLFSVNFSAVPGCFTYMHQIMHFRISFRLFGLVNKAMSQMDADATGGITSDDEESDVRIPSDCILSGNMPRLPEVDSFVNRLVLHSPVRGRNTQTRNGINSRSIQKRRSSSTRRKARNLSPVIMHKANGALVSDLICSRKNGIPFSSVVSKNKIRSSIRRESTPNLRQLRTTVVGLPVNAGLSTCSANLLIIESDRCYREAGATVILEISDSREWSLAIKIGGSTKFTHKAEKVMRPCSCNRFTNAIIWSGDDNWKLEFPDRQEWFIFKDLYKYCSDRNVAISVVKAIPVPGVHEVSGYETSNEAPFRRPVSYISIKDSEIARAMAKRSANYDMDSEDEEWLREFNNESAKDEVNEQVSEDKFELMVDTFEKACYHSPVGLIDDKAYIDLCLDLGAKEVVESVYNYWMKKRKQKRSALLRVFQVHQVKKGSPVPKPPLRKKRSFKRQASQLGKAKQPISLQAIAKRDALEEKNAMLKVKEAKITANRSMGSAVRKRKRAQLYMENADLAIYRAVTAFRIAETAKLYGLPDDFDAAADFWDFYS